MEKIIHALLLTLGFVSATFAYDDSTLEDEVVPTPSKRVADSKRTPTLASTTHKDPRKHRKIKLGEITLIHIGDLHGHLVPRPNLRSDAVDLKPEMEGGLAQMYTLIQQIREAHPNALLVNTGDTVQGSPEALFTRGQAVVDVLDQWGIDAFAIGNWDFLYGTQRTFDLWGKGTGPSGQGHRWGTVAANCYCTRDIPGQCKKGALAFPPYKVKSVNGVKIGFLGFTTQRGIPPLPFQTTDFRYTGDAPGGLPEMPFYIQLLRTQEHVDIIVMLSELGLGNNIFYAEKYPGVDVILSADMHETTPRVVRTATGTMISEVGQDGTKLAEYRLKVANGRVILKNYVLHTVTQAVLPHPLIARQVREIRAAFVQGKAFMPHVNPFNGAVLNTPVDTVVGQTKIGLYRGNFSNEEMPGVIEGTSHDFLADTFRDQTQSDIGTIRGFRYGTAVRPGPISLEDIYHFLPTGPQIATGTISGQQLKHQLEVGADGALSPQVNTWSGGWIFGYSGVKYDLDPYKSKGSRVSNITVQRWGTKMYAPLDLSAHYSIAGFYYAQLPEEVGGFTPKPGTIRVHTRANKEVLDGTDVVVNYLKTHVANPAINRVKLLFPLPEPAFGNPEIQPLRGVPTTH